jgi:DNA-binding response OmpR family regulator
MRSTSKDMLAAIKILIVDDHQHMRKVLRTMLTGLGVKTIHEAADGESGLHAIMTFKPDLVLLDWDMPVVDGLEFVRTVRKPDRFPFPDLPIILLTGHGERWRVIEAARYGVHEYLLKPVSTQALLERITAVLEKPRQMMKLEQYYVPAPRGVVMLDAEDQVPPPAV